MITVGVIGTGYIGPVHLEALRRLEGIRVKAVCDVNLALAQQTAKRFDIPYAFDSHERILNDGEIDVIHNCTPNKYHYPINKQALERGGFTYWPKGSIPPGCESTNPLEPLRPLVEGQWRRPADRKLPKRLALTDAQVASWFSSPEEFWKWLTTMAEIENQLRAQQSRRPLRFSMAR